MRSPFEEFFLQFRDNTLDRRQLIAALTAVFGTNSLRCCCKLTCKIVRRCIVRKRQGAFQLRLCYSLRLTTTTQVCRSSSLSGPNIRWPRRMLPLVSHGEHADRTDRQTDGHTDGRTPDRYITLSVRRGHRNNSLILVLVFSLFVTARVRATQTHRHTDTRTQVTDCSTRPLKWPVITYAGCCHSTLIE